MIHYNIQKFELCKDNKSYVLAAHTNDTFTGFSEIVKCPEITRTSVRWGNRSWQNFDYEQALKIAAVKLFGTFTGVSCYYLVNEYKYKKF